MELIRPPMGWNSYDYYDTNVNEAQVKANADFMAENLKDYGWEYIVVDIEWYAYGTGSQREKYQYIPFSKVEMDEYSRLFPVPQKFPSSANGAGFEPLASYIHSLGLKFGIHIMRGIPRIAAHVHSKIWDCELTADQVANPYSICDWNPDMYGVDPKSEGAQAYYDSLMQLYAEWGVDLIKCDDIARFDSDTAKVEIEMIHEAIEKCSRDIVLSLSPGPALVEENTFYKANAEMWRITDDFWDDWDALRDMFDKCKLWQGKPDDMGYPDCDMLPIGMLGAGFGGQRRTNLTHEEQRSMITLWCMFRSPLMIGAELTKLDPDTMDLLTNLDVIRLTEASLGAREVFRDNELIVWKAQDRYDGSEYVALFNLSTAHTSVCPKPFVKNKDGVAVEVWKGEAVNIKSADEIPAHGCMLIKIS